MKRRAMSIIPIAVVTTLALSLAARAHAQDTKVCSNNTLNGTYGFKATGILNAPQPQTGQIAIVGKETFDGDGNTAASQVVSLNGVIFPLAYSGTYQVNADCTGTLSVQPFPGVTLNFFLVIDDNGKQFQSIQTDAGAVVTANAQRE